MHKNPIIYFSRLQNQRDYCLLLRPSLKDTTSSLTEDLHNDDVGIQSRKLFTLGRSKHFIQSVLQYFLLQPVAKEQPQGDQHWRTDIENHIFNHERYEAGDIIGIAYDAKHYGHGQNQCNQPDQSSRGKHPQKTSGNDRYISQTQKNSIYYGAGLAPDFYGEMAPAKLPVRLNIRELIK